MYQILSFREIEDLLLVSVNTRFVSPPESSNRTENPVKDFSDTTREFINRRANLGKIPRIMVNLEDCEFMDSQGLRALILTQKMISALGGKLELARVTNSVNLFLELVRAYRELKTADYHEIKKYFPETD